MASKQSPASARKNESSGAVISKKGLRLNPENVVKLLLKTSKDWRWLAKKILEILPSKLQIFNHQSSDEECLKQAVEFWLKKFVYASWRWVILWLDDEGYGSVSDEIRSLSERLLDTSLTSDNISAALAMLDDKEFEDVVYVPRIKRNQFRRQSSSSEEYRILLINYWMMSHYNATWEWLAGRCFYKEKEKALEEVKKHFQRKLESTLTLENLIIVLADVKDWSDDRLPCGLRIPYSKVKELEKTYPDLTQRQSAIIQLFLEKHPAPSWEIICFGLYVLREYKALEVVQNKYFKGTSETRRHFQVAMKRGKGKTSTTKEDDTEQQQVVEVAEKNVEIIAKSDEADFEQLLCGTSNLQQLDDGTFKRKAQPQPTLLGTFINYIKRGISDRPLTDLEVDDRQDQNDIPLVSMEQMKKSSLTEDLLRLLQQFDVDEHVCTFEEHKVYDIDTFKELTTDDFKEMGITLMGDIVKLQKALAKGQLKPFNLREKDYFLCIVGHGRYTRQPTDSPVTALAAD